MREREHSRFALVLTLERRDGFALILVHRLHAHGAVADVDLLVRLLLPRQRMLHPILVVSVRIILAGMSPAGFFAVRGGFGGLHGAGEEIAEFEGLDEIAVPDHTSVLGADLVE